MIPVVESSRVVSEDGTIDMMIAMRARIVSMSERAIARSERCNLVC